MGDVAGAPGLRSCACTPSASRATSSAPAAATAGAQLDTRACRRVAQEGRGVVVYLRGHEGRGIGLLQKLRAYELQDQGADTIEANVRLGLPVDGRDYAVGAQILRDLGISRMRLMTPSRSWFPQLRPTELVFSESHLSNPSLSLRNSP